MMVGLGQISYPGKRWRQKERERKECESPGSKKAISIEKSQQEKPEELYKKILTEWMGATPSWATGSESILEIEKLKIQNAGISENITLLQDKMSSISNLEQTITNLQRQILEMQKAIESLKPQNRFSEKIYSFEEIRKISNENMREIEIALNLSEIDDGLSLKDRIRKLDGFLKEYLDDNANSVDLVREIREDW